MIACVIILVLPRRLIATDPLGSIRSFRLQLNHL